MPSYIVTYTSMAIDADTEEAAIDRAGDMKGGGNWEAEEVDLEAQPLQELPRALARAQKLIDLGADEGEPEETQLSDVLADLMHWANHNHVDFDTAVASAARAREAELAEWDVVLVSITNTYTDGCESEVEVWVPGWGGDTTNMEDWWQDVVFPHTGDGEHTGGAAEGYYEASIVRVGDENDTTMCGVSTDWAG